VRLAAFQKEKVMTVETSVVGLLEDRLEELSATEVGSEIRAVQAALRYLEGESDASWAGIGVVAGARWLLRDHGAHSTSEIWVMLRMKGVRSRSKKPVASLYASLSNSRDFVRLGSGKQGKWALRERAISLSREAA
jgi:hypothetical protein